jgi:hypothetical protein
MNWLCWHVGTVTDPKFTAVGRATKTPRALVLGAWAYLLEIGKDNDGDVTSRDPESCAVLFDAQDAEIAAIFDAFATRGMIDADGVLANWAERQNQKSTDRVRAHRARVKRNETDETVSSVSPFHETHETGQTDTTDRQTEIRDSLTDNNTNPAREKIHALALDIEAVVVAPPEFAFGLPSAVEMLLREGHTELEIMDAARVIAAQGKPIKTPRYLVTTVRNRKSDATRQTPSPRKPRYNPADASSPDAVAERRAALALGMRAILPTGDAGDGSPSG